MTEHSSGKKSLSLPSSASTHSKQSSRKTKDAQQSRAQGRHTQTHRSASQERTAAQNAIRTSNRPSSEGVSEQATQKARTQQRSADARRVSASASAQIKAPRRIQPTPEQIQALHRKIDFPENLPVSQERERICDLIVNHQVVIVCGETGSGKTTQLPKMCLSLGRGLGAGGTGLIGHTQPRRLAATSTAKRIAEELNTDLGEVVGYKIRFADRLHEGASVKLMTDGILLAETQTDRLLRQYDTIIIDEAHERSLNIDFLLGYLREILPKRPDLKVIITSATIDAERFAEHFAHNGKPAPIINVSGRTYPVEIRYRPIQADESQRERDLYDGIVDAVD